MHFYNIGIEFLPHNIGYYVFRKLKEKMVIAIDFSMAKSKRKRSNQVKPISGFIVVDIVI